MDENKQNVSTNRYYMVFHLKNFNFVGNKPLNFFFFLFQGKRIEKQLQFNPSVQAFDQDRGINASLQYSILSGKYQFSVTQIYPE